MNSEVIEDHLNFSNQIKLNLSMNAKILKIKICHKNKYDLKGHGRSYSLS